MHVYFVNDNAKVYMLVTADAYNYSRQTSHLAREGSLVVARLPLAHSWVCINTLCVHKRPMLVVRSRVINIIIIIALILF